MNPSKITVRSIGLADFAFIRDLSAAQPNFTIPPPYVLWLLLRISPDLCLIAEHPEKGSLAYLLAMPVSNPPESVYVWQLAGSSTENSEDAITELVQSLRAIVERRRFKKLIFSAQQNTPTFRALKRYARQGFSAEPQLLAPLPDIVAPNEHEFYFDILPDL